MNAATLPPPAPRAATPVPSSTHPALHRRTRRVKKYWKPVLGIVVGLAIVAWVSHVLIHVYHYEKTDDAYITGHVHQVSAQVAGRVQTVLVDDNDDVKAGQVLARLDPLEFQIGAQKAAAALAQAKAQLDQAHAGVAQAVAAATEAKARVSQATAQQAQTQAQLGLAKLTLARNEQLFSNGGAITQADLDNARSGFAAAQAAQAANEANLAAARAGVGSAAAAQTVAQAQVEAAQASVAAAEAAGRDAQRQLDYATVVAPAAGRIGNKAVEPGNRVQAGQTLFNLAQADVWIVANFKETQLPLMKPGQAVDITVDALPDHDLHGTVDSLAPATGAQFALLPADNATGNFNKVVQRVPVKIVLDHAAVERLGARLRPGLSVIVDVRVR
ncbi:HlyD family secretion protein [Horticoccus luteus]|uniref:HlyD family secretion protein n=1 Tax=Horticoccus luteus TaxID=2862869 RepID=A0A8F9XLX8_9BACT|nr:HlyD family secretion protein [Horticoccus luteus]QYM79479.1 HlyD family secretion protein [Horticoccus luteus]